MEKLTVMPGSVCDGASFTGSSGNTTHPSSDRAINVTITENDDM